MFTKKKTDWLAVAEADYVRYENFVGMVVASKSLNGQRTGSQQAYPAGYQYVGNPSYGFWGGGGFWQFYGQYALMRDLMGGGTWGGLTGRATVEIENRGGPITDPGEAMASQPLARAAPRQRKRVPAFITDRYSDDKLFLIKFQAEWARPARAVLAGGALPPVHLESRGKPIGNLRITFC